MKRCGHCRRELELSQFGRDKNTKDGLKKTCKQCLREAYRDYHSRNPEKSKDRVRKWRTIPENQEKNRKTAIDYYWSNPEINRQKNNLRKQTDLGRARVARYNNNRRNRVLTSQNNLTLGDINTLKDLQADCCAKCKRKFSTLLPYTLDHILPLSMGGGLTLNNTQLLCRSCNSSKQDKTILFRDLLPNEVVVGGN